jgi:hypothetical protein
METANQAIGKVFILYGKVKAVAQDGTERVLGPNSVIYANERIVTEADGSVSIMLDGPPPSQIDLGRMSDVLLNEDVYAGVTPEVVKDAAAEAADAEKIQEALEGQGEIELDATAAGGAAGTGGQDVVRFNLDGSEVTPESGAETTGIGFDTVDTLEGATEELAALEPPIEPPVEPPVEPLVVSADPPSLMLSVGAPEVEKIPIEGEGEIPAPVSISVTPNAQGIWAYADVSDIDFANLANTDAIVSDAGRGNGIGVKTGTEKVSEGAKTIEPGEALVFSMNGMVTSAVVKLKHAMNDDIVWQAYGQDGIPVGDAQLVEGPGNESWYTITVDPGDAFYYLVISGGADSGTSQHGFNVFSIVATPESIDDYEYTYTYPLTIDAALTDTDGSEFLGPVLIPVNSLPHDATIEGTGVTLSDDGTYYEVDLGTEGGSVTVNLVVSYELTPEEINGISGSVMSTETGEGEGDVTINPETATTYASALIELNGTDEDDLLGTDANELIKGGAGADTFVVGQGDDIILDYSLGDDIVKIGVEYDALAVENDGSGKAKLVILDGGNNPIGSVTFEGIDYTAGMDVDALKALVDIDDGTSGPA